MPKNSPCQTSLIRFRCQVFLENSAGFNQVIVRNSSIEVYLTRLISIRLWEAPRTFLTTIESLFSATRDFFFPPLEFGNPNLLTVSLKFLFTTNQTPLAKHFILFQSSVKPAVKCARLVIFAVSKGCFVE